MKSEAVRISREKCRASFRHAFLQHAGSISVSATEPVRFASWVPNVGGGKGMRQDSAFKDPVRYDDGFRTGLIGTPEQIAERIVAYKGFGVLRRLLLGFLHHHEEVEYVGRRVPPLVRGLESRLPDREAASAPSPA
jgi:alkanesulfonate monooxygenase SsuD/methylene tetrahydromethanopterin reductase-like flavin-dependent oxidoreductase (luciferase family)